MTFNLSYSFVKRVYTSVWITGLGNADHNTMDLLFTIRTMLYRQKVQVNQIQMWSGDCALYLSGALWLTVLTCLCFAIRLWVVVCNYYFKSFFLSSIGFSRNCQMKLSLLRGGRIKCLSWHQKSEYFISHFHQLGMDFIPILCFLFL